MKINEHTALSTPTVLLVPYSTHHVPPYHEWMKDPDLQAATASEPLSLEEEYAMQASWRNDADKLTFIICLPLEGSATAVTPQVDDSAPRMIGDINLFFFRPDSEEMGADVQAAGGNCVGEVELMIARKDLQQRGFGRAGLLTFVEYVLSGWGGFAAEYAGQETGGAKQGVQLSFLRVKIHKTNKGSIRLFESVGFIRTVEEANYFGEVELRWLPDLALLRRQKGYERAVELEYR